VRRDGARCRWVAFRLDRQTIDEPSLAMSFVVHFVVLASMVAIVANISVPDIQLSTAADLFDGPS
jgi:hypothetical protein